MAGYTNALFGQDDSDEHDEIEDNEILDDGQEDELEVEVTDDEPEVETDEEEPEESSEETEEEVDTETETDPETVKLNKIADGRLNAVFAEREKRKASDRENEELRKRIADFERQQQEQAQRQSLPDVNSDPEGYAYAVQRQAEERIIQERFHYSDQMARAKHGPEKVEAAAIWATAQIQQNPNLQAVMYSQPNPLEWVVEQYDREQEMTRFLNPESREALFEEYARKKGWVTDGQAPVTPATPVVAQPAAATPKKAPPKRAAAAQIASPGRRDGSAAAPSTVIGALGLK